MNIPIEKNKNILYTGMTRWVPWQKNQKSMWTLAYVGLKTLCTTENKALIIKS